jgi:glyoxylase-like metal-dependent hydrolase (beta-lactamase superfamily II)
MNDTRGETTFVRYPHKSFDWRAYEIRPAPATTLLADADVIDIGDRRFEVLHLPGHSPGCIALYEADTRILLSGDVIYDGTLYDHLRGSSVPAYRQSLERLRSVPVSAVHGGHRESFGPQRMNDIIDSYLEKAKNADQPAS